MNISCPNIKHPGYITISEMYGGPLANLLFHRNGDKVPTIDQSLQLLHPNDVINIVDELRAWDTGSYDGKSEAQYEKEIDALILKDPNAKVGGGESFNQMRSRAIRAAMSVLQKAPYGSAVITHSSLLKFVLLWDKLGRPNDWSRITPEMYLDVKTTPGQQVRLDGPNGKTTWIRHGETEDNADGKLRTDDTLLTEKGKLEAKKIGQNMSKEEISSNFISPLPRAIQTADSILDAQRLQFRNAKAANAWVNEDGDIVPTPHNYQFQLSSKGGGTDLALNEQLGNFVKALKGEIREVPEIVINGKKYNANAVTNILNRTIEVVEGRMGLDTLPEEVGHLFVAYLPEGSKLLKQMLNDITSRPVYEDVMDEYRDNPLYQNEDGSINDDKIAREAIGKMIAKAITDKWAKGNREEKSTWQKLWNKLWSWIKGVVDRFRNEPTTEELPYNEIASDILTGKTSKLDMDKIQEAGEKGMYYLQQTDEEKAYDNAMLTDPSFTDEQRETYKKVHYENHQRLELNTKNGAHEYRTLHKNENETVKYTSNTMAIHGDKQLNPKARQQGEWSAKWGTEADSILRAIAMGHDWEHIEQNIDTPSFTTEVKQAVHNILLNAYNTYVDTYTDGSKDMAVVQSILTFEPDNAQKFLAASSDLIIIAPDGSIKHILDLKTSLKSLRGAQVAYARGKGSWLPLDTTLTKREEYALQLTNEMAMIQIAHPDLEIQPDTEEHTTLGTHSIVWKIDPTDPSKVIGALDDGFTPAKFDLSRWTVLSGGAFVPPGPRVNIFDEPTAEELEDAMSSMTEEEKEELLNSIQKREKGLDDILDGLNKLFISRSKSILPEFGNSIANNFKKIAADIQELRDQGERNKAMLSYINAIQRFTNLYSSYIKDPENFKDESYYQILQETIKMAEAHLDYLPESTRTLLNQAQLHAYDNLRKTIHDLKTDYTLFARRYVNEHVATKFNISDIKDKNGAIIKTKEQQIQDILWAPENDLTVTSLMGDAIREMTVPLLGQLSLIVDKARLEHTINSNKIMDDIAIMGKAFETATGLKLSDKEASDFLFNRDAEGNRTRWMDKIGDTYYQEKSRVDGLMMDPTTGKKRQFIADAQKDVVVPWNEMVDGKVVTTEISQTEYNIKLDALRKERREFYDPESIDYGTEEEPGNFTPVGHHEGVYHSLSEEYQRERNRVMRFSVLSRDSATSKNYGEWVGKRGVSKKQADIDDFNRWSSRPVNKEAIEGKSELDKWNAYWKAQVDKFHSEYQTFAQYWQMEKEYDKANKAWTPSGRMVRKSGFFPNEKHIVVNEDKMEWNGSHMEGIQSLQSKQYLDLKNDQSSLGKARFEFYNNYMAKLAEAVKKGGDQTEQWYKQGGLINLSSKFFKTAAEGGILNQIGHFAEESFTAIPQAGSRRTDDFGVPRQELMVPFMSNVRNKERIREIKESLTTLEANQKVDSSKLKLEDYLAEKKRLEAQLKSENHKNDIKDLEVDPIKLLSAFSTGVEKYAQMAAIEGQVLSIRDIIRQEITDEDGRAKQFWQLNNIGQKIMRSGTNGEKEFVFKRKNELNSLKKVEDYVKMFYGETYSKKTIDVIADRIMNITSFGAMGFNYMGHFKNSILYQASNFRQNIAERFVTRRNYTAAQKEFFANFLPGMQTKIFEKKSGPFKAKSKMEWMMHNFGLDVDTQLKAQGKSQSGKFLDNSYMGENFAIHWAQYTMQGAYMRDQILKGSDGKELHDSNGNVISLYDAYQWDPNTGKCTLRPEAAETMEQQKLIVIQAKDIQTKTQGNFEEMNKPLLKNYMLGRILSQFHNYFKTAWNDRFDPKYQHASLGEIEGTWTSLVSYYKLMREFEGHWFDRLKNGWKGLNTMQQKNLKTDLAEVLMVGSFLMMGFFIKSAAKGISAKDDPRRKKFMNLLAYTMNAVGKEQGAMDPIAGWFTIKDFVDNPAALTPVVTGIINALTTTAEFPFQDDAHRYYQRGVFKGNAKAAEDWKKILPLLKQMHRWSNFAQETDFDPTFQNKN